MTQLRILQFGATGQVAREAAAQASELGISLQSIDRATVNLVDQGAVYDAVLSAPEGTVGVINAAAYTAVDAAEDDVDMAMAVNAVAPGVMARACRERGLGLVHLSTDYVFGGDSERAYRESDAVAPLGVYGRSKRAGEEAVLEQLPEAIILRTSWVFSVHGKNFLKAMLRLARDCDQVSVVDDQFGCPTPAHAIAAAALNILTKAPSTRRGGHGLYHFAGDRPVSWKQFAEAIFNLAAARGMDIPTVTAIPTSAYPTRARRPLNSVLDCSRIERDWGIVPADWRRALHQDIDLLIEAESKRGMN